MIKLVQLFICIALIFSATHLLSQDNTPSVIDNSSDRYFPVAGDNNAFGLGGQTFINTSILTGDFDEGFAHFFGYGINDKFSVTVGTAAIDFFNPELIYLTPEGSFSLSDNMTLGVEVITVFDDSFSEVYFNPGIMLSIGTSEKNISIGYAMGIDSDGEIEFMSPLDGFYAHSGIRVNGRLPIDKNVGIFSRNDLAINDGATLISRTGFEFFLDNVSLYVSSNFIYYSDVSETDLEYIFGLSFRL